MKCKSKSGKKSVPPQFLKNIKKAEKKGEKKPVKKASKKK